MQERITIRDHDPQRLNFIRIVKRIRAATTIEEAINHFRDFVSPDPDPLEAPPSPPVPMNHGDPLHTGDDDRIDLVTSIVTAASELDGDEEVTEIAAGIIDDCHKLDALLIDTIRRERDAPPSAPGGAALPLSKGDIFRRAAKALRDDKAKTDRSTDGRYVDTDTEQWQALGAILDQHAQPNETRVETLNRLVGSSTAAERPLLAYARLLELCDEFGIDETDTLKHQLEDWDRWNRQLRSGELIEAGRNAAGTRCH